MSTFFISLDRWTSSRPFSWLLEPINIKKLNAANQFEAWVLSDGLTVQGLPHPSNRIGKVQLDLKQFKIFKAWFFNAAFFWSWGIRPDFAFIWRVDAAGVSLMNQLKSPVAQAPYESPIGSVPSHSTEAGWRPYRGCSRVWQMKMGSVRTLLWKRWRGTPLSWLPLIT